jgi:hypothetical protein
MSWRIASLCYPSDVVDLLKLRLKNIFECVVLVACLIHKTDAGYLDDCYCRYHRGYCICMATYTDDYFWCEIENRLHIVPVQVRNMINDAIDNNTTPEKLTLLIQGAVRNTVLTKTEGYAVDHVLEILNKCAVASQTRVFHPVKKSTMYGSSMIAIHQPLIHSCDGDEEEHRVVSTVQVAPPSTTRTGSLFRMFQWVRRI